MDAQNVMKKIQFLNKYSRYSHEFGKRENWSQTVSRTVAYLAEQAGEAIDLKTELEIYQAIWKEEISPSMRLLATAGKAAEANQVGVYNCSFLPLQHTKDFYDLSILLGHGVGVGFSVEKIYVDKWPTLPKVSRPTHVLDVEDSIQGWADSFLFQINAALEGESFAFDYSRVRPAGAPLMTRGGTASGPGPLKEAHLKIAKLLRSRQGLALRSVDLFDIACHIASAIVAGGVRRSAMIAIFDQDDNDMLRSKSGEWYLTELQRQYANISQIINDEMTLEQWRDYVCLMDANKSGEPGIWSRYAIKKHLPLRRQYVDTMGPNPCVEQILRPYELCNLSQIIARSDDTLDTLKEKIRLATIVGTIQSSMTDFKNVNPEFAKNCQEERLLGVSISGIMDCPLLASGNPFILDILKWYAIEVNEEWAAKLGINCSVSVTCVKPDGNTSVLYDTAPGVHGRFAPYYLRRMRVQAGSPVANFALNNGIPAEPAFGENWSDYKTLVLSFPVKSPEGAIIQRERCAVEQLNSWLAFKKYYTETNPSVTINYKPNELDAIAVWLFEHQDYAIGLSFIPVDDSTYAQMPYEEITAEKYEELNAEFKDVDMLDFWKYEARGKDTTEVAQNLACTAGACVL